MFAALSSRAEDPWLELCGSLEEAIQEKAGQHSEESVLMAMRRLRDEAYSKLELAAIRSLPCLEAKHLLQRRLQNSPTPVIYVT